jgi:hypothetical protein
MKVEQPHPAAQSQRTSTGVPFRQLLTGAKQSANPPAAKPARQPAVEKPPSVRPAGLKPAASVAQTRAVSTSVMTAATQRQLARVSADAEAERLATVRASHHQVAAQQELRAAEAASRQAEKVEARVLALIVKELESTFDGGPAHVERAATCDGKVQPSFRIDGPPPPAKGAEASARAEQAVALIERIETFVRSSRPALALTLNNSLGARVEIERLGPGRVALKLTGQKGPPGAGVVSRIRDELRARGLEVGALRVA